MNTNTRKRARAERDEFNDKLIERLQRKEKRYVIHDTRVRELALKVEKSGAKTFFWYRSVNGKPVFKTIGAWGNLPGQLNLTAARIEAQKLNVERTTGVVGPGTSFPEPKPVEPTFGEIAEQYVVDQLLQNSSHPEEAAKKARWALKTYLALFSDRPLSSITRGEVIQHHAKLGREIGHATANVRIKLLKTIYNWAKNRELFDGPNPGILGKQIMFKGESRDRYLSPAEQARLAPVLLNYRKSKRRADRDLADFIALAVAVGIRKENLTAVRWEHLIKMPGSLELPETKTGKMTLVLSPEAIRLFQMRRREQGNPETGWVFPNPFTRSGHMVILHSAYKKLMLESGIENVTVHDLRRTFATNLLNSGAQLPTVAAAGGWKSLASLKVYVQVHPETVAAALALSEAMSRRRVLKARRQAKLSA